MVQPASLHLVRRPDPTAALRASLDTLPLTVLSAPAGYGKTSLLDLALEASDVPSARYTAQLWHAGEFAEPLSGEIRRVRPDFGRMTIALARRRPAGEEPAQLTAWAQKLGARFAEELDHVRQPLVVAMEDVHLLQGDRTFADFLTGLMSTLPPHVHLAVAGRTLPDFALAAYLSSGRARMFTISELRFEPDDVLTLGRRLGVALTERAAADLCAAYEGWAAGIALALRSGDPVVPTSDGSLLARSAYLLSANIDALPKPIAEFLTATSVFETLYAAFLDRDGALGDVRAHLRECERLGVMLSVVAPGETYRLHPMLREALLERMRLRGGTRAIAAAHASAAELLATQRLVVAALYHFEAADDDARTAHFLQHHAYDLFIAGRGERVAAIARRLHAKGVAAPIAFAYVEAMLLRQRGEAGAEDRLLAGIAQATAEGDGRAAATLRHLLTEDRLARREPIGAAEIAEVETAGAERGDAGLTDANAFAGWSLVLDGDFTGARDRARRAFAHAGDDRIARARVSSLDAYAATCLGAFEEADALLATTLRSLEGSDHVVLLANALVWYARLALLWGDDAAAYDYASQGAKLARDLDLPAERAGLELALAEVSARRGDRAACARACDAARRVGDRAWYAADRKRTPALVALFGARAAFAAGDPAAAFAIVDAERSAAHPAAQRAALAADAGAYGILAARRPRGPLVKADLAIIAQATAGDALDAIHLLGAARIASALAGDDASGATARNALRPTVVSRFAGLFARRENDPDALLGALDREAPRERAHTRAEPRGSALTARENEILQLLAEGLTNKEIAQRFSLSPRTVDTHVERVLAKLDVTSRTRAVAAALRLGLVAQP